MFFHAGDEQKEVISDNDGNSRNYYGRVVSGSHNHGYKIEFD